MVAGYRQLIAGDAEIRDQVEEIEEALPEMMECKPFFDKLMQTTQRIFIPPEYEESRSRLRAVLEAAGGTALEKSAEDLERQANGVSENIESTTAIADLFDSNEPDYRHYSGP